MATRNSMTVSQRERSFHSGEQSQFLTPTGFLMWGVSSHATQRHKIKAIIQSHLRYCRLGLEAIGCVALEGRGLGDSKAEAGFSTCRERYGGVCVWPNFWETETHNTERMVRRETDIHTERDRQTYMCIHAEREGRRGTKGGGKRILGILTIPVVCSMWMGTEPLSTLSKVHGDSWVSHQIYI